MVSFLGKVKIFSFWPKTMDYSQAFLPNLSSFFEASLLLAGRCYEAEICAILLLLRCPFVWYPFWPKSKFSVSGRKPWTIRSQAFLPNLSSFFEASLLLAGRCYEAEICAILLLLRCPFVWYPFWPKSKFSVSGRKPWTIRSQAFLPNLSSFFEASLLLAGRCYEAEICAILLLLRCPFVWYPFWPKSKFSVSGRKPWTI